MGDIEITSTEPTKSRRPSFTGTTTVGDEELRYRRPWFFVSVVLMLFLYAVSIYFAVIAIQKYATQPIATTISYWEAKEDNKIAFPAVRVCPLSNKKNLKFQRVWWLPSTETRGKQMKAYLTPANLRTVAKPPPYPPKTAAPVSTPTMQPTVSPTFTLSPTVNGSNATQSPTVETFTYDYDYIPTELPDDYQYDAVKSQARERERNCFTWNDVNPPQMSGNKRDALFMIVDVDLPQKSAKYNTGNCSAIEALSQHIDCTPNSKLDAVDSASDAMGLELTLFAQGKDPLDYTTLYVPAATQTKVRMNAKKTNRYEQPDPEWEYVATTSQVFFQTSSGELQLDSFTAAQVGHVATVDQLVFLEIKFGDMSVTEITESKTYEAFNAFGDATAIFGFFTGFALWGGMNISQIFLWIVSKFQTTKRMIFEDDVKK